MREIRYNVRREAYIWKQFQFFIFKSPSWIKTKERGNDHLCLVPDELSFRVQKKANGAGLVVTKNCEAR